MAGREEDVLLGYKTLHARCGTALVLAESTKLSQQQPHGVMA
jgi:hypothetical protein